MKSKKQNFINLKKLILKKKAKIGIFGLGYVGLPLALRFLKKKFIVHGFDINYEKIKKLKSGNSYIKNIPSKEIKKNINKNFFISDKFENVKFCDVLIFCLPTPLKKNKQPDLSYLKNSVKNIKKYIRPGQLFSNESTSYPGTTEEIFLDLFKNKKLEVGKDVFLAFSPEREDPGNKYFNISNITKVISARTSYCLQLTKIIYNTIVKKTFTVKNIRTAEMTKLLENTFRCINIAFVNEMKIICNKMDLNIWDVVSAAKSKPFGYLPFSPGPGVGGHCIPIDPHYLTWKAKKYDSKIEFINLATRINESMPKYVSKILYDSLEKGQKKIIVMGVAYKPDVDDYRQSPSLEIIQILKKKYKLIIDYNDPYISNLNLNDKLMKSKKLNYKSLKNYDATLILTNHSIYNKNLIYKYSNKIIDTRGMFKKLSKKIIKA